jgi:protein SCO1/2
VNGRLGFEHCWRARTATAVAIAALATAAAADAPWSAGTAGGGAPQSGVPAAQMPGVLRDVAFDQRLGESVRLDLELRDEHGRKVRLGDLVDGKPAILALVYYQCPMLCTQVLNGLVSCLDVLQFDAGREFEVITVSFDARETPELAAAKKAMYLQRYERPGAAEGWHFLTADSAAVQEITAAVGFRFVFDEAGQQFAHASGIVILTPDGRLARYFYGVEYPPKDVRLGLVEAGGGKIGNLVDQVLLYCFHYDPTTGKYGAAVINLMRLAGAATVLALAAFVLTMRRRERRSLAAVRH